MKNAIELLIKGMDDDLGVNETMYEGVSEVICKVYGEVAAEVFENHVDACDGQKFMKVLRKRSGTGRSYHYSVRSDL